MRIQITAAIVLLTMTAVHGCGEPPSTSPPASPSLADPQLKALEKARGVEQMLEDQAAQRRKDLDVAEK